MAYCPHQPDTPIRNNLLARLARNIASIARFACFVSLLAAFPCPAQTLPAARPWDGPTAGPLAQQGKKIVFISQDLRNGGITVVYRGFYMATLELGWDVAVVDGKGDPAVIRDKVEEAIRTQPDAIVFGGFQPDGTLANLIAAAKKKKIVLAGWHAAEEPGPTGDLFVNIATGSSSVVDMTVNYMIQTARGNIGVIIFNDNRFAVANAKTKKMRELIAQCGRCKLLSVENIPISDADKEVPKIVPYLDKTWGKQWTHTLAINDRYFDVINHPLDQVNRPDIRNIAAGDGSHIALGRIRDGRSQQIATVAEPPGIQGWQLADELNRAFAGKPPSGYVSKPILATTELLQRLGSTDVDAGIPYREAYKAIWKGSAAAR
jgi:ribose transport system substrate-binding protein